MASLKNLLVLGSARFVNTIKGTVEKAEKLLTARTIQTNLTSTSSASFDGSANITPGVTGTLPASSGGTGKTSAKDAANTFINALDTGVVSNVPTDSDYFVSQYIGGNGDNSTVTGHTNYYRRPLSQLWLWISTKLGSAATASTSSTVGNDSNLPTGAAVQSYVTGLGYTSDVATTSADGLMSSTDKAKLDGIAGQSSWYGTCATAAGTAAKVVTTTSEDFILTTGSMVRVKFTNNDTYNGTSTLNVDGTGAKSIMRVGTSAKARYYWLAGEVVDFVYDGTNFTMLEGGVATTTYYGITKLSSATNSTSTGLAATASAVKAAYDLAAEAKEATEFGTVGSEGNPIYFDDGVATPGFFTWGVDDDQNVQVGWDGDAPEIEIPTNSALPVSSGGTGATTAEDARTNLGLGSAATYNVVSTVNNDSNLVTGAAIKTYYEAVGIPSAISTTSASTAAKVATCSSYSLLANSYIQVILATANSASSALTLNINSKGAKPIYINGTVSSSSNKTLPAGSYFVFYDGTNYYFRTDGKLTGNITGSSSVLGVKSVSQSANTLHDFNTFTVEQYAGGDSYNLPNNLSYVVYTTQVDSANYAVQLALGYNTEGAYYRRNAGGTWTQWYRLHNPDVVQISNGGTGATTKAGARTELGLGSAATYAASTTVGDNSNLVTGAAIMSYVSAAIGNALKYQEILASSSTTISYSKTIIIFIVRGVTSIKAVYVADDWNSLQLVAGEAPSDVSVSVSNKVLSINNSRGSSIGCAAIVM